METLKEVLMERDGITEQEAALPEVAPVVRASERMAEV